MGYRQNTSGDGNRVKLVAGFFQFLCMRPCRAGDVNVVVRLLQVVNEGAKQKVDGGVNGGDLQYFCFGQGYRA